MTLVQEDPLSPGAASFVVDPFSSPTVELDMDLVCTAQPTSGPNRMTLFIPTESTVLSLGQKSPRWNTDVGITGYSDSHIHFETHEGPLQTIVSLGGPATTADVEGWQAKPPLSSHGYSMVTVANAWHDAMKQHYLLSTTGDVTLRAMAETRRAVLQADQGVADLNGGLEVNLAGAGVAITAHPGMPFEDIAYTESWGGETPHSVAAKRAGIFNGIVNGLATAHNLWFAAPHTFALHCEGNASAIIDKLADVAEWAADAWEFRRAYGEVKELLAKEEAIEGCIKIDAEEDFGVSAGTSVSFFGIHGASLGSTLWSSVSGIVTAGLKGTVFAGVAAAYTSLKGYKSIEIGCDHGDTLFEAKKNVKITAKANLIAVGKKRVQVTGEKHAYLGSKANVWIGTTAGSAWGAQINQGGITIGKANGAGTMMTASVAANRSIKIVENGFTLTSSDTTAEINRQHIEIKASQVTFDTKDEGVKVGGKKVLVDGP